VRAGAEPARVFALAHAVVARWWEQAFRWERETVWPRRLHQVAGGDAGTELERWRIVGRDAVVFPEVAAVVDALLEPAMVRLAGLLGEASRTGGSQSVGAASGLSRLPSATVHPEASTPY
jgi:hypothetical protein